METLYLHKDAFLIMFMLTDLQTVAWIYNMTNGEWKDIVTVTGVYFSVCVCDSVEIANKMQPCNRIYYSTVHWRLNMFRAAYRSSSGAPTVFAASGLNTHVVTGCSQIWVGTPTQTWLRPVTTSVCKPEAANTVGAPDDERHTARNMLSF